MRVVYGIFWSAKQAVPVICRTEINGIVVAKDIDSLPYARFGSLPSSTSNYFNSMLGQEVGWRRSAGLPQLPPGQAPEMTATIA